MDLGTVDVVLVRPSRPANVAAACRAMKNMGLRRLCLVGVEPGFVAGEARNLAYGAWDVLDAARFAGGLPEAVAPAAFVAGTSERPTAYAVTPRRLARLAARRGGPVALVFGPEASGLTVDELGLCHARVRIPADPGHPSLNLAQAVLILAYELRLAAGLAAPAPPAAPATSGDQEEMLDELRQGLLGIGYLNRENPEAVLGELRRLLARAAPTVREVTLLRGLARQIRWAAATLAASRRPSDAAHGRGADDRD
jgi:tRNA (cytidine32/uridine32-2'-O)-methyltransferase